MPGHLVTELREPEHLGLKASGQKSRRVSPCRSLYLFAGRGIQLSGRLEKIQEVAMGRGAEAGGNESWPLVHQL